MEDSQFEIVSLYGSRSKKRCMEYALVLQAVGIRCEVLPRDGEFALVVHARDADRAREQLRLYLHENPARPPRFDPRLGVHDGLACACLYGVTILLIYILQRDQAFSLDWWRAGMSHAGLIREGEWWRAVTALGLHADTVHLAGNLVFGIVFGFLAGELVGCNIAEYPQATVMNHDPLRKRKLLLKKKELRKFAESATQQGLTMILLSVYFSRGIVKVKVAVARGRKLYDKRERIRKDTDKQDMRRAMLSKR